MTLATVFGTRISPFVEKVVRAFWLKRVPFELVAPKTPLDLKRWNPQTGKIPVAELGGRRVYDSTLILRSIEELHPDPPLLASDPAVAARQRLLEDWADESLYWATMAERWSPECRPGTLAQILATVPGWARPAVRAAAPHLLGRVPRAQGFGRLPRTLLLEEAAKRLDDLVAILGDDPFFFSQRPSVADLAVFAQLARPPRAHPSCAAGTSSVRSRNTAIDGTDGSRQPTYGGRCFPGVVEGVAAGAPAAMGYCHCTSGRA